MTPILIVGFGISPPIAIATDVLYAAHYQERGGASPICVLVTSSGLCFALSGWGESREPSSGSLVVIFFVREGGAIDWLIYPLAVLIALAAISLFVRHLGPEKSLPAAPPRPCRDQHWPWEAEPESDWESPLPRWVQGRWGWPSCLDSHPQEPLRTNLSEQTFCWQFPSRLLPVSATFSAESSISLFCGVSWPVHCQGCSWEALFPPGCPIASWA